MGHGYLARAEPRAYHVSSLRARDTEPTKNLQPTNSYSEFRANDTDHVGDCNTSSRSFCGRNALPSQRNSARVSSCTSTTNYMVKHARMATHPESGSLKYKRYDTCVHPPPLAHPGGLQAVHVTRQRPLHPHGMLVGVRCRHRPLGGVADGIARHEHLPQLWQRARAIERRGEQGAAPVGQTVVASQLEPKLPGRKVSAGAEPRGHLP